MANLYDFTERLKLLLYLNHRKSSVNTRHFDDNFQAVDDFARETDQKFIDQDTARSQLQSDLLEIIRTNKTEFDNHAADQTNPHAVSKLQVGLGNADNTSDMDKPVSTAQAAAVKAVQDDVTAHKQDKDNPHTVTKSQVGLGNVPNVATNDQTPSYTAATTLAALVSGEKLSVAFGKLAKGTTDLISHLANKSNPHGVTKAQIGLGSVDNTADKSKPVSTPQQDAIDAAMAQANAYTLQKIADLINGAPESMDTLKEVADAIAANEDVMAALNAAIGIKASQAELDGHTGNTTIHITATERTKWNGAVNAKHSHANKALLDTYTQTEANLKSAVDNKHSHGNKSVIDKITQAMLDTWDTVSSKAAAVHKHVKADITDFPASLKNPTALTVKLNGTDAATYDGSIAKEVNVTPAGIGAAASSHTHSYLPLSGGTLTGNLTLKGAPTADLMAATKKYVDDLAASAGNGDMLKSVYDTNGDGIVDNAAKVNGLTVLTAVPVGAKFTDTTYSAFKAATASAAGGTGLVPAPAAGAQAKYLRADGTWQTPPNTTYGLATASANGLMSAADKAKMDKLKDESVIRNVTIATSAFVANTDDNAAQYPYCADYTVSGMTATCWANVNLLAASKALGVIEQGNTMAGKLRLYANAVPSAAIVIDNIVWKEVG